MIVINDDLLLKPLEESDALALFSLVDQSREYLREWLPWLDQTKTPNNSSAFIQRNIDLRKKEEALLLGIFYQKKLIGMMGFNVIDTEMQEACIGYWVADGFQGKGIISQSARALISHGFKELGLLNITIACAEKNIKSIAVAERLGFRFQKTVADKEWLYDHYVSHVVFEMTAEEWVARD